MHWAKFNEPFFIPLRGGFRGSKRFVAAFEEIDSPDFVGIVMIAINEYTNNE